jgi:RNA polymerase sigma-70 factor (sigma-E family)
MVEEAAMAEHLDFEAFCLGQNPRLIRMLTLYCGDAELARDLTQETLARAWVHWRKVRKMDRPDLWTKRVALNLATSQFRRRRNERIVEGRLSTDAMLEQLEEGTDRVAVRAALMRLSERQRTAILLRYLEDLSVEQTADLMLCSAGTVKKLTARGLVGLRAWVRADVEVERDA